MSWLILFLWRKELWQDFRCYARNFKQIWIHLLKVKFCPPAQVPFHICGGGPNPSSAKLRDSGQIPPSITPIIISLSISGTCLILSPNPIKSQDLVVWSCKNSYGNTETIPSLPKDHTHIPITKTISFNYFKFLKYSPISLSLSDLVSFTAKPLKLLP